MIGILVASDYRPVYIKRGKESCPHCGTDDFQRTNRYLYRCTNLKCGRYW